MSNFKLVFFSLIAISCTRAASASPEIKYLDVDEFRPMTLFYAERDSHNEVRINTVFMPRAKSGSNNQEYELAVRVWLNEVERSSFRYNGAVKPLTFSPPMPDIMLHSSILIDNGEKNFDLVWLGTWRLKDYIYFSKDLGFHIPSVENFKIQFCEHDLFNLIENSRQNYATTKRSFDNRFLPYFKSIK